MNGVSVIAEHCGGSHDRPRCSAKTGADADPNLLTSPATENIISHLHKFGSDRILDILLILCSVVIGTRETKIFPERPADVAMPVQAVRVGHSLSFRRSRGSPGYSTWGACRGSNSRAGHCTCGTFLKATPKSGSVRGDMPKFLTDFEAVAATLGEAAFMHRWGLLLQKYPAAESYLTKQLGGTNVQRWGAAFLQTFTCSTRSTSRGEGSNKDYKVGNKRNIDVVQVYKNITGVQDSKKKRRLQTNVAANIDSVGAVECAHLWFQEATRIFKQNCSPYAQELVHRQMVRSSNYYVKEQCVAGVLPPDGDLNSDDVTLTQGDSVSEVNYDVFDLNKFCISLATADLNDADPYRRCNLSDYLAKHEVGEDFTVLTVQHDKYDVVQYVILFEKVDMGSQGTCATMGTTVHVAALSRLGFPVVISGQHTSV